MIILPEEQLNYERRQLLKTGISVSAWLSLNSLFNRGKIQASESYPPQRKLVWINMRGGWDTLETVDPKPTSTSGIDAAFSWNEAQTLQGAKEDIRLGRWLPRLAQHGEDLLLLRGLAMGTTSHDAGSIYMETGILSNAGRVNAASIPAIIASESTATIPIIQLSGGGETMTDRGLLKPVSLVRAENLDLYRNLFPSTDDQKDRQLKILSYLKNSIQRLQDETGSNDRLSSLAASTEKIETQVSDQVGSKLALTNADRTPFQAAGMQNRGQIDAFALALKLIKQDLVTCVNLGMGGFDTHSNQDRSLQPLLTNFDIFLSTFISELKAARLLDSTLIIVYSDFGRTPKINASNGRDHWPVGGAMMIGGGILGGRAVGGTDDQYRALNIHRSSGIIDETGIQMNPTHLGAAALELTLGTTYLNKRPYLEPLPALVRLKS